MFIGAWCTRSCGIMSIMEAGTFGFSCFMDMRTGKIVVEDESGQVPAENGIRRHDFLFCSLSCAEYFEN